MTETKVYRGRALPEVIETVRAELGPDAIVMRQRTGLAGGIGGFFAKQFVEVEAIAGPLPAAEEDTPFEKLLEEASAAIRDSYEPVNQRARLTDSPEFVVETEAPADIAACELALVNSGLDRDLAELIIDDALKHSLPFAAGDVRKSVRRTLSGLITTATGSGEDRRIAITGQAGSGRTSLARSLAAAYAEDGTLPVALVRLGYDEPAGEPIEGVDQLSAPNVPELAALLGDRGGIVIVDAPAVSATWADDTVQVAADLLDLGVSELHFALPATMSATAANEMLSALGLVRPTALAITFADRTRHLGTALGVAIDTGMAVSFLASADGITAPDAAELAEAMLP